jgi:cytochrome d ubiquinol oxidase subunit II
MTHRTEVVENDNMSVIGIGRLVALALLASATLGPALAQQQQKPNILVIMADDIGPAVPQLSEQARRPRWIALVMTALFFLASFKSLGAMFWPYMIPYSIAGGAAAPDASLQFLFYGGIVVLPVVLVYTVGVYWVFRGRIRKS